MQKIASYYLALDSLIANPSGLDEILDHSHYLTSHPTLGGFVSALSFNTRLNVSPGWNAWIFSLRICSRDPIQWYYRQWHTSFHIFLSSIVQPLLMVHWQCVQLHRNLVSLLLESQLFGCGLCFDVTIFVVCLVFVWLWSHEPRYNEKGCWDQPKCRAAGQATYAPVVLWKFFLVYGMVAVLTTTEYFCDLCHRSH